MSASRPLLLARLYYFLYYGAIGCYFPYVTLYFERLGLSGKAIGALAALAPLVLLGAGPAWGALGDRFRIHRYLLPLATFGPILPMLLLARTGQFQWLALLLVTAAFFSTPSVALIDSAVLDLVEDTGQTYGSIRVWGSIGFTVVTWGMGYVLKLAGLPWMFYSYGVFMLLAALVALRLPARRRTWQTNFRASLGELLGQRPLALFLLSAFLVGAAFSASLSFYPLHLQALGGDAAWIGLAGALGAVTEMPALFYSQALFRRLGVRGSLVMAYAVYAVRWAILALVRSPLLALLTQLLHGLSFGAFLVGGVAYVDEHTPAGLSATAQSLFVAMVFGLGSASGALIGGWLYDTFKAAGMFGAISAITVLGLVVLLMAEPRPQPAIHPSPEV